MTIKTLAAFVATLALAGCGSAPQGGSNAMAEAPAAPKIASASDVLGELQKAGLKVTDTVVVTEQSDDNHLLGRPNQYTSQVFFHDARHPKAEADPSEGENSVEFFATAAEAKARHDYIEGVTKGVPMLLQYQVLQGRVLARFDKVALPSEVEEYKAVLEKLDTN